MRTARDVGELAVALGYATRWQVVAARAEQSRRRREDGRCSFLVEVLVERRVLDADRLQSLLERGRGYRETQLGDDASPLFGDIAVRKNYVTSLQVFWALQQQRDEDAVGGPHRRLGDVLLDQDWLSPWELEDVLVTLADLASGSFRSGETPSDAIPLVDGSGNAFARRRTRVATESGTSRLVRDVMAPAIISTADAPLGDALDTAYSTEAEVVLIVSEGELVGCLAVWDHCQDDREMPVGEVASSELATVGESAPADEAVRILGDEGHPCVAVTKHGELVGVVTRRLLKRAGVHASALDDETVPFEELGAGD
jgi:CBS domain-containing protein